MSARARRGSFRCRLAALIAAVFITGGAALLGAQYLLVQHLLEQQIDEVTVETPVELPPEEAPDLMETLQGLCPRGTTAELWEQRSLVGVMCFDAAGRAVHRVPLDDAWTTAQQAEVIRQVIHESTTRTTTTVSEEVLRSLVVWSVGILVAFAALAVLAAWWLSKRSLGRIARITTTARGIDPADLQRRLALPGPADEIKELGDTIDSMLDRIEDAFDRQDRFVAGASHELRTPLATTRTLLEIPLEQGRVPADLEPDVRAALAANDRSARLVAALLAIARASSSSGAAAGAAGEEERPTTDLTALVEVLVAERERVAMSRAVTIDVVSAPFPARTTADTDQVLLAVSNLIDNALRHNVPGGSVVVRTGAGALTAWVEVANDGADLTAADLDQLKEPFHRGAASRLAGEGLGLGLALVVTVAGSAGGTLTLTARPQGGLVSRLTLPSA